MSRALSPGRRLAVATIATASGCLLAAGGLLAGHAASAAFVDVPVTGDPGRLVLAADPYPAEFFDLSPGDVRHWQVQARLEDAETATLALELRKDGALAEHPRGLQMDVSSCASEWEELTAQPVCPSGAEPIVLATPADDFSSTSPVFDLPDLAATAPTYLLVSLSIEDSTDARADESLMGIDGDFGLGLTAMAIDERPPAPGAGETPAPGAQQPPRGGALPATGGDMSPLLAALALAGGLLAAGTALRVARKDRA